MSRFFQPWPKIPRMFSKCVITEKIDGTNASVLIMDIRTLDMEEREVVYKDAQQNRIVYRDAEDGYGTAMYAFSRKRHIWPGNDNFAFAAWVWENADELISTLGPGRHFGEWWGAGIQRTYGQTEKRFSLFNANVWSYLNRPNFREAANFTLPLYCVPVLYKGDWSLEAMGNAVNLLAKEGSQVGHTSKGKPFLQPEGIVVFFNDAQMPFKYVMDGDAYKEQDAINLMHMKVNPV